MDPSTALVAHVASRRFVGVIVGLGLLLGVTAFWGVNKNSLGLFHDDGIYTVVAKSLYQGDGYRIISLPTAPIQTKYPFLYSYLLSWMWAADSQFPQNILYLKAVNIAFLVAIFLLSIVLYRQFFPTATIGAILFSLLVCTNPIVFTFTDYVVSDLLLVMLVLAALVIGGARSNGFIRLGQFTSLVMVTGLACLSRLAAAPMVFAGAVQTFITRGWRGVVYFIIGVSLLMAPWFFWVRGSSSNAADSLFTYYVGYEFTGAKLGSLTGAVAQHWPVICGNARYLLGIFDFLYLLPLLPGLNIVIAALTAIGMLASLRRAEVFLWCLFLSSLALLITWPFHPGRYVAPLVPILFLFLFRGMDLIEDRLVAMKNDFLFKELASKIIWVPAVIILLLNGVWLSSYLLIKDDQTTRGLYGNRLPYGWHGFEESFDWIRRNTEPEALLASAYDPMYYLYTGRRAIRPALHRPETYFYPYGEARANVGSVDVIKPQLDKLGIDYLIIDPLDGFAEGKATAQLIDQLVGSYGDKARRVFTSADGKHRIYQLARE